MTKKYFAACGEIHRLTRIRIEQTRLLSGNTQRIQYKEITNR